jgi:hypothetical protein
LRHALVANLSACDAPFFDHFFRAFLAAGSVAISSDPASARRSPSPLTATVGAGGSAETCCWFAVTLATVGPGIHEITMS